MAGLEKKKIALLGTRKIEEQTAIIEQLGGSAVHRPAQGTIFFDAEQIEPEIHKIINGQFQWAIFTTGIGFEKLFEIAKDSELDDALLSALQQVKIAIRGYKTANALKKRGLTPLVRDDDGSIEGLIRQLEEQHLSNLNIAVQLYGDPHSELVDWLIDRSNTVQEILPYQHIPPQKEVLEQLLQEVLTKKVDAVSFTSTPQVKYFFQYAEQHEQKEALLAAFEQDVVALSVGKVTGKVLTEAGVKRVIMPQDERMGSALMTLNKYYKETVV
ncbi:uroporphyrinogen-III synthase [Lysinibacillus sp. BW-2-10]|uniref:uroporphyrinogen-III synthase n=1 Tax=Lysinibacillus sp. BW-2-10 TaxID=2590030 RepID=UPI00117D139A|nr:uroporphyrinogen-III synthase [Lysinibacillus sp. BW-2-10]TSI08697.1 uroporphyrinogen-III synthase [Lysinibacillus sp. BW-2-10]